MKKGFTLIELVVVLIIVAILGTLGLTNFSRMIEKSRGAEAKEVMGNLRRLAAGYYMEYGSVTGIPDAYLTLGTSNDMTPTSCAGRVSHYFSYAQSGASGASITLTASRCTSGGKPPQGSTGLTVILTPNLSTGSDVWSGNGGY